MPIFPGGSYENLRSARFWLGLALLIPWFIDAVPRTSLLIYEIK
jgi:hypothetical protein